MGYSLTYVGVIVMVLSWILQKAGVNLPTDQLNSFVNNFGVIIGAVLSLYGRYRAGGITALGRKV